MWTSIHNSNITQFASCFILHFYTSLLYILHWYHYKIDRHYVVKDPTNSKLEFKFLSLEDLLDEN